ncbi:hypothetical protein [Marinobacter sp. C2H3]|uniref:hypothetical protein n=1 Tax=Marinobacter sp. C2H3 TaxID=3119003 RepID=UPI00300E86E1
MNDVLRSVAVQTLWQGEAVELLAIGQTDETGYLSPGYFEVRLADGAVLYQTRSRNAAHHYLTLLLGADQAFAA